MALVQRYDSGRLSKVTRTGAGGARVPASIARTGIQIYQDAQGRQVREYRAPDVVFAPESLATLGGIPVTIGHPGDVDASNWRRHAVGHVSDAPPARRADGEVEWLDAAMVVQDAAAIARIERGELAEVSMGYRVKVVPRAGVTPDGQHYDAVQEGPVTFNHLALLPPGKARAGSGARLRLDASGHEMGEMMPMFKVGDRVEVVGEPHMPGADGPGTVEIVNGNAYGIRFDKMPGEIHKWYTSDELRALATKTDGQGTMKVKIDGIEYDVGSSSHIQALERQVATAMARADKAEADAKANADALGKAQAKADAAEGEVAKLKAQDVNALVQDELAFRALVTPALPKAADGKPYDFTGKSRDQVRADAVGAEVMAKAEKLPEAARPGYIQARLEDKLAASATPEKKPLHEVKSDAAPTPPAKRKDPVAEAYAASWSTK